MHVDLTAHSTGPECGKLVCRELVVSGTVAPEIGEGLEIPFRLVGVLWAQGQQLCDGRTIQVLLHGSTYNRRYWDFGVTNGVRYSYAQNVASAGFPTFNIDRLGAGDSTRPLSSLITMRVAGHVVHTIVAGLRDGSIAGVRFGRVITVGHSWGSIVAWREAVDYGDVDGLIITGTMHEPAGTDEWTPNVHPTSQDPQLRGLGLDDGYVTTRPGSREYLFYHTPNADPAVIASDEAGKDVYPDAGEGAGGFEMLFGAETRAIQAPVLVIMGARDSQLMGKTCDCSSGAAIAQAEAPYYSREARVEGCAVPHAGHSISLHRNHRVQEHVAVAWARRMVGQVGR
jgi:pimeloyl-ACP methyl ester carboxylesterase